MLLVKCTDVNNFLSTKSSLDSEPLLSFTNFYQRIFQTADHFEILLLSLPATNSLANFEPKPESFHWIMHCKRLWIILYDWTPYL